MGKMELTLIPVLTNLSMTQSRHGKFGLAIKAATLGLKTVEAAKGKLDAGESSASRAKLLYQRASALVEKEYRDRDLDAARKDLLEAAKLMPKDVKIRQFLTSCSNLLQEERRRFQHKYAAATAKDMEASMQCRRHDPKMYTCDYSRFEEVYDSENEETSPPSNGREQPQETLPPSNGHEQSYLKRKEARKLSPAADRFC